MCEEVTNKQSCEVMSEKVRQIQHRPPPPAALNYSLSFLNEASKPQTTDMRVHSEFILSWRLASYFHHTEPKHVFALRNRMPEVSGSRPFYSCSALRVAAHRTPLAPSSDRTSQPLRVSEFTQLVSLLHQDEGKPTL